MPGNIDSTHPKTLYQFLEEHKCKENDKSTHTRIPNRDLNIRGGSYSMSEKNLEIFKNLYCKKVFINKQQEYLTEAQLAISGPVLIDLDFRYDTSIEDRQHNESHVEDIIELYLQMLKKVVKIEKDIKFPVFVLEKPNVNTLPDVTKDGIHIIIGLNIHHEAQLALREYVLEEIDNVFTDLPIINDYDSVIDKGITTGKTNWQLYGSRKPGNEAYELKKYYDIKWDDDEKEFEYTDMLDKNINHKEIFDLVSARKKDNINFELNDDIKEKCKQADTSRNHANNRNKIRIRNVRINGFNSNVVLPNNIEKIEEQVKENLQIASFNDDLYEIKEVHEFTMALSENRADDYNDWFRLGLALHECNTELLFPTWILFSTKSKKFDFNDMASYWKLWNSDFAVKRDSVLTRGSIMWWCKQDNPVEYKKIKEGTVDYFINKSIATCKPPDYDIAGILHKMYGDQYKCVSIKNNKWYEMINGRWSEIDSGTTLRKKLSSQLSVKYTLKQKEILQKFHSIDENFSTDNTNASNNENQDDAARKALQKTARRVADISLDLRRTPHKNNIMKEAKEHFFDKHFMDKLDNNPNLLCFNNGVIDFEKNI